MKAALFGHTVALVDGHCASGFCHESAATRLKKVMQRMTLLWESSSFFDVGYEKFYEHAREIFFTDEDTSVSDLNFYENVIRMRNVEFINGKARFLNLDQVEVVHGTQNSSKGAFLRIQSGFLKLLVRVDTEEIVGIKIVGKNARELIHFGMELCETQATLSKIIGSVFNEYTFHELYKLAALDALYKLRGRG